MSKTRKVMTGLMILGAAFNGTAQSEGARVTALENRLSQIQLELDQLKNTTAQAPSSELVELSNDVWSRLAFGGALEAEAFYGETGGESESDLTLATAEFTIDAAITEGVSAHVGLLWEEDDTEENNLDEAYVTFGATEDMPYYLTVGKMYLPFGNFESAFISDPLTLEMAEINESAALAGFANDLVEANVAVFNGDADEDSSLENLVASVTITPAENIAVGAYWISDLLETDGFEDFADALPSYEKEAGAGVFLNAQFGEVALNAEYVTALSDIDTGAGKVQPSTYNIEASMPLTDNVEIGAKFEGSDEFYATIGADKFADRQYGVVAAYAVNDYVTVAGEYLHAEGLDDDEDGDLVTMQLALEF